MVSPAVGKVILVPFPFSDLSESKLRPAVVLADARRGDWILCQVTSNPYGDPHAVSITDESFSHGALRIASFARPGKLFTASSGLMLGEVGMLKADVTRQIINRIIDMLKGRMEQDETDPGTTG
ncbi:MAG TPA: type II toxin-antitoxin system PemK/MazF family toxin [Nitrospirota bacterium]